MADNLSKARSKRWPTTRQRAARKAHSELIRRYHKEGRYDASREKLRYSWVNRADIWHPIEEEFILKMLGSYTIPEIQAALAEQLGKMRSIGALITRISKLGRSVMLTTLSISQVMHFTGYNKRTIMNNFIKTGDLPASRPSNRGAKRGHWSVKSSDLERLCRTQAWNFHLEKMPKSVYRSIVEVEQRLHPYYTTEEVASLVGYAPRTILHLKDRLDGKLRIATHGKTWVFSRDSVMAWYQDLKASGQLDAQLHRQTLSLNAAGNRRAPRGARARKVKEQEPATPRQSRPDAGHDRPSSA